MHNWSCDLAQLKKRSAKAAERFVLEQKVNFGLGGSRIAKRDLLRHWKKLRLDPQRKRFLSYLLWNRKS